MEPDTQHTPTDPDAQPAVAPEAIPSAAAKPKRSRRQLLIEAGVGIGGLALLIAALFSNRWRSKDEPGEGLTFVIPKGAGAAVNNSTLVSAVKLPTAITFEPGDEAAISVRNEDTVPLRAGPFVVLPGQTYIQRFPNPGEFVIDCAVDPTESITVTVLEA